MSRTMDQSGGPDHVALVKLATKKAVDFFAALKKIMISYEQENMDIDIKVEDGSAYGSHASFSFRPDIIVFHLSQHLRMYENKWHSLLDSRKIIIEAETNPSNIFGNVIKMEAYKKLKVQRREYAFILVCYERAVIPANIEPFDEIWRFPRGGD